jgi:hypothetical protein
MVGEAQQDMTKDMIEPISMIVPRKSESFQDDIYPETHGTSLCE